MFIPFGDKSQQAFSEMLCVGKIGNLEPLSLQNREPLFDLVHPRTMDRWKAKQKARVFRQPGLHVLPFVHAHIVEHNMHRGDRRHNLTVQMLQNVMNSTCRLREAVVA